MSVGLLFAILGGLLFVLAFLRSRHSRHDFADRGKEGEESLFHRDVIQTVGQEGKRIFGRPFITAGWIVVGLWILNSCPCTF